MKQVMLPGSGKIFTVGKVVCVGKNYLEHAKELGDAVPDKPVIFMKPPSAMAFSPENIVYPSFSQSLHYETELVALVGKTGYAIPKAGAYDYIAGYAVGLDMTLRDLQANAKKQGHPWTVSKCFDTSALLGPFIAKETIPDPQALEIKLWVNGILKQDDSTRNMMFSLADLITYVSGYFTLEEGDLLFTGTPKGVGETHRGDVLKAQITGLPLLETAIC